MATTSSSTRPDSWEPDGPKGPGRPVGPGGPDEPGGPFGPFGSGGPSRRDHHRPAIPITVDRATAIRLAAVIVPLVFFTDRALFASTVGVAATGSLVCFGLASSVGSASLRRPATVVVPATVALLAAWLSVRQSPWLVSIDIIAIVVLVMLGPSIRGRSDLLADRRFDWLIRGYDNLSAAAPLVRGAGRLGVAAHRRVSGSLAETSISLGGVAASAGIAVVLLALLASGDAVFASFFTAPDAGWVVPHVTVWLVVGFLGLWVAVASVVERPRRDPEVEVPTAPNGSSMVLATVVAVLGLFSVSQLVTLVRGRQWVLDRTGLTFAEYARQGFFQLLWVAGIVLAVLVATRLATGADHRRPARRIVVLSSAAAALTIGLVVVSLQRMLLYEDAFGLTMLRLYVMGFAGWMALVLAATSVATATAAVAGRPGGGRRGWGRRWLGTFVVGSAVAGVLVLNAINPEAVVVDRNLDRAAAGADLDIVYLVGLSADGRLRLLDEAEADPLGPVASALCHSRWRFHSFDDRGSVRAGDGSIWSYNRATSRHADRIDALCSAA